jgi:hypothetical protein
LHLIEIGILGNLVHAKVPVRLPTVQQGRTALSINIPKHQPHIPGQWLCCGSVIPIEPTAGNHVLEL